MNRHRLLAWLCVAVLVAVTCALYVPFLGNPMVFDDLSFYSGNRFAYYATTPFGFDLRLPPNFTLAVPQVLWVKFPPWHHAEIHRIISLAFHVACALALLKLIYELLRASASTPELGGQRHVGETAAVIALIAAIFFAIHPVAVYGAGYLVQRTIVLATLFSLLSLIIFVRGLVLRRYGYAIGAALLYTLAVFSKEHSLPLPAVAVLAIPLVNQDRRFAIRYAAAYLAACVPAAISIVVLVRGLVGRAYEPAFDMLLSQIEGVPQLEVPGGPWLVSAITQAGLFFKYLTVWLVPDTGAMSIDVRIDFAQTWSIGWIVLKVFSFIGLGAIGAVLLFGRGNTGLLGFGLLYFWIMYSIEFTSVRFQEPFVLYRSYLWAPGIMLAIGALLNLLPRKFLLTAAIIAVPILFYQGHDRLRSFSSALALWEDAAAKLPSRPIPWGSRTLFGLAGEQVFTGRWEKAMRTADQCIAQYPKTSYCYFSRGAIHLYRKEYEQALVYLDRSLTIYPRSGIAHHHRGFIMEQAGRLDEAREAYERAYKLGFMGGLYRLNMLDGANEGNILYDGSRTTQRPE